MPMTTDTNVLDEGWQKFLDGGHTKPIQALERFCFACQHYWVSRQGTPGWNRCPHCGKYYCASAAEGLVEWARLAREQAAQKAAK